MSETDLSDDHAALLTRDLRERILGNAPTGARPRRAATLVLVDDFTAQRPKVLMGKRNPAQRFMPGVYVFPGGGVEPCDRSMNVAGVLDPITEERLLRCLPRRSAVTARALALAAIRETFEETGLIVGTRDFGAPEGAPDGAWQAFAAQGVYPSLEQLHFVARAITPPRLAKRFDVMFFAADISAIAGHVEGAIGADREFVELSWIPMDEVGAFSMPVITQVVLKELKSRHTRGMQRFLPVPFYHTSGTKWVREEI